MGVRIPAGTRQVGEYKILAHLKVSQLVLLCRESKGAYQKKIKFQHRELSMREIYVGEGNLKKRDYRFYMRA